MMRKFSLRVAAAAALAFGAMTGAASATEILVIDNGKLWTDTKAGKDAQRQLQDFRGKLEAIVGEPLNEIAAEAKDLVSKYEKKEKDAEFAKKARVLQLKENQIQQQAQAAMQQASMSARKQFYDAVRPHLLDLLKEKKADILVDTSQVMFTTDSVEATSAAIMKIESKLKKLEIDLPELKTDGESQGPAPKKGKKK